MMVKRLLLPSILALLALLALCMPASAHAILVRSDPPDGAALGVAPQQLRLWFSEPIAFSFTTLELIDGDGQSIPVRMHSDAMSLALAVRSPETAAAVLMIVDLPQLAPNVYRLHWRTLSNNDLHTTEGSLIFGVGRTADHATASVAEPLPAPFEVALRWIIFAGEAGLIGALAVAWLGSRAGDGRPSLPGTRRRLQRLAIWSAALALVAGCVLLLAQKLSARAPDLVGFWQIFTTTSYGSAWALRQSVLAVLMIFIWLLGSHEQRLIRSSPRLRMLPAMIPPHVAPPQQVVSPSPQARTAKPHAAPPVHPRWQTYVAAALLLALAIAQALQSHATAFDHISPLRVLADTLHLLAVGLWSGGVLALAVAVVPLLLQGADEAALAWTILRRFGALASAALATLLITGLFMTGQQVASLDALLATFYGRALMLKVALALVVALLGLRNAAALHPFVAGLLRRRPPAARPEGALARRVMLEAAGALALLLLAAGLSAAQPARGPEFAPPSEAVDAPATTTRAGDLIVTLTVKPNLPGRNFISLGVFNTRRPAPAPISAVSVGLQKPGVAGTTIAAQKLNDGRFQVVHDDLASVGDWQISAMVKRPGLPDTTAVMPWTVAAPQPQPRPVLISNRPLAPILTLLALLVALLLGAAIVARFRKLAGVITRTALEGLSRGQRERVPAHERPRPAEERLPQ